MILSSNGGKSDAWAGQERGRTTIACIQRNFKLRKKKNPEHNEHTNFKTLKSFYSYWPSISAKLRARQIPVGIPALAGVHGSNYYKNKW
jgi:hypothetical protein